MDEFYFRAYEKFGNGAYTLATSRKDVKERLFDAAYDIVLLQERDIPENLRDEANNLIKSLTNAPPISGIGSFRNTINNLSEDDAVEIAKHLWDIYEKLHERVYR